MLFHNGHLKMELVNNESIWAWDPNTDKDPDAKREWKCAKITREILDTEKAYQHHPI